MQKCGISSIGRRFYRYRYIGSFFIVNRDGYAQQITFTCPNNVHRIKSQSIPKNGTYLIYTIMKIVIKSSPSMIAIVTMTAVSIGGSVDSVAE